MDAAASHIWQSTVVAAGAAALAWMCRQNRASVRHAIWLAASMKFLMPFALLAAVGTGAAVAARVAAPERRRGGGHRDVQCFGVAGGVRDVVAGACSAVWFIGTLVVLARWAWEWTRLAAMVRGAALVTDGPVFDALRRAERTAGIRTPTTIVSLDQEIEPGVIGLWRPVLVWPRALTQALSVDRVEAIVAHEMVHVMRRDNLLASVHMLVSAAFWFHPVVWWIGARLVDERERACDEQVLAFGHSPDAYAAGILKTCEVCVAVQLANVAAISGGELKERLRRIVCHEPRVPLGPAKVAVLVCALLAVLIRAYHRWLSTRSRAAPPQRRTMTRRNRNGQAPNVKAPRSAQGSEASVFSARDGGQDRGRSPSWSAWSRLSPDGNGFRILSYGAEHANPSLSGHYPRYPDTAGGDGCPERGVIHQPLSQTAINQSHIAPDTTLNQARCQPKSDSLANGMLVGAGIGAVVGMLVIPRAMCGPNDVGKCSTIGRVAIGLPAIAGGLGIGALVDSRHKQDARPAGVTFNVRW